MTDRLTLAAMLDRYRQNWPEVATRETEIMVSLIRLNDLIDTIEGPFKTALDRYKYATRYTDAEPDSERAKAATILMGLNAKLDGNPWLGGESPCFADMATVTFVRQFAMVDLAWFRAQDWLHVIAWLDRFLNSDRFATIMAKYPQWVPDSPPFYTDFSLNL